MKIPAVTPHTFPAQMTLAELFALHYIPDAGMRRTQSPSRRLSRSRISQLERLLELLRWYLVREPVVADLRPDAIPAFLDWFHIGRPGVAVLGKRQLLESLCRYVGTLTSERGKKPWKGHVSRELSDALDTLWGICIHTYFPKKLKIRSRDTMHQYRMSVSTLKGVLGRDPVLADLTEDNCILMAKAMLAEGLSPATINERVGRLTTLWTWLAKRRIVHEFPTVERLPEPRRIPKAWTRDDLERLFAACNEQPGLIVHGITAADWWVALHAVLWDSGERIGAIMLARWAWLDPKTGMLEVPAEARKLQAADRLYQLHAQTMVYLERLRPAGYELVFPWPYTESSLYKHYNAILRAAVLPTDRRSKFHRMRKSVASHSQAAGIDACSVLGHSSPVVARESYLDPRIIAAQGPSDVLFRPDGAPTPRLEYRPTTEEVAADDFSFV